MNILYGVQTTGNGHISRSREVIYHLKELGHTVQVILSGKDPHRLEDSKKLSPSNIFRGLTFYTHKGGLQTLKTAYHLKLARFYMDVYSYQDDGYDLVVTDFEPLSARIARRFKIPCIGLGHQYAFFYDIPVTGANPLSSWIIHHFAPADIPIGLHWHHFNQPVLPPIVPIHLKAASKPIENKILVYLPFEEREKIEKLLLPFDEYRFFIYGINSIEGPEEREHLFFRPFSRQGFLYDLADCSGVISNAGFELSSEALHIGKRLLVKPLRGQLEQLSNALALEKLSLAATMHSLDKAIVQDWLSLPDCSAVGYPDVALIIAQWLGLKKWDTLQELADAAWSQVSRTPGC
jgi:uncharacterized protein (TIGR00661 family)